MFFCWVGLSLCIPILQDMLPPLVAAFRFGFKLYNLFCERLDPRNVPGETDLSLLSVKPLVNLAATVNSSASSNQLAFFFLRKVRNIVWRSKNKFQCST
jgi:hypothetical protein